MAELISIIAFVAAILNIILFFKLWGMTNDIRELKKDHFDTHLPEDIPQLRAYLRENFLLEDKVKVKRVLIQNFLDNIQHFPLSIDIVSLLFHFHLSPNHYQFLQEFYQLFLNFLFLPNTHR